MDPELKRQLEEIHALTKDNHQMLRAIRRHQWYGVIGTILFWVIMFAVPFYVYQQYLQPLVAKFAPTASTSPAGMFGLPSSTEVQKLINSYKTGQ